VCRCQPVPGGRGDVFDFQLLRQLVHALMRQAKEPGGVARAHLQFSGSQYVNGASSRAGCPPVFFVGLLAKSRVGPDRLGRGGWQLHVINNRGLAGIVDEQLQRLADASPSLINSATLRVAAAYPSYGGHPSARLVSLVGHAIMTSRLPQPSLSKARLQVALDTAQQTRPDVFTGMNRHGHHTATAFDA
jgi:hypothetical protein